MQLGGPRSSIARVTPFILSARKAGADIAVMSEGWLNVTKPAAVAAYSQLAADIGIAVVGTYSYDGQSGAVIFDAAGKLQLNYSKLFGTVELPSAGAPNSALLIVGGEPIRIGALLGTDVLFMEPARSLMLQGVDLAVHPTTSTAKADRPSLYWSSGDNRMFIATANAADAGGSALLSDSCYFASEGGSLPGHSGPGTKYHDGPCVFAEAGEKVVIRHFNLTASRQRLREPGWDTPREVSRKPFDYQPLCYQGPREKAQEKAALLRSHRGHSSESGGSEQPLVVRVALLQMAAVQSPKGVNPTAAAADKAERFIRQAKAGGADVALMPELWSIGFLANSDVYAEHYLDPDSAAFAYDGVLKWAEPNDGPYVRRFQALAKELGIAIGAAFLEQVSNVDGDTLPPRNSVAVIDRHGDVVYTYAKVHPAWGGADGTDPEGLTQAGRSFYSGNLDVGAGRGNVTVCSNICFDREHPESARLCMMAGAELLLMPTACGVDWTYVDKVATRARSNAMAVAMTNYAISPHQQFANGHSMGVNADGTIVTVAPGDPADPASQPGKEGVFMANLDIGALRLLRNTSAAKALMDAPLVPRLCRIPVAEAFQKPECNEHRLWL